MSSKLVTRPRGYKIYFVLNSDEHEFYPAHKCLNNWYFNIYYAVLFSVGCKLMFKKISTIHLWAIVTSVAQILNLVNFNNSGYN